LKAEEFLSIYQEDGFVRTIAEWLRIFKPEAARIMGLHGSLDAVVIATLSRTAHASHLIICRDKEEALYLQNDLSNLLGQREILLFPMSYKRPYEYEETENANVLMRAETLNRLSEHPDSQLIVTYPEALSEKVINRKTLAQNTFSVKRGERLELPFLEEFLHAYEFEKTDFVYEAGQFAIRGGIIDVFSFAHELPYRIELFGDEVDSIRTFDPGSQLSVDQLERINLLPNVQSKLITEERQSFLDFVPAHTRIWLKDTELLVECLGKCFDKATARFDAILKESGQTKIALAPAELFETPESIRRKLSALMILEFGNQYSLPAAVTFSWHSSGQPSFNKNFEILASNMTELQMKGYGNFISAEQQKQLERLQGVFDEIQPGLRFTPLTFSVREGFVDHQLKICCYTDHQIFERFYRYRAKEKFTKKKALTFRELQTLQPGDFVTHIDYGIAKFAGLEKKEINGHQQEAIRLVFKDDDILYASIHSLHKISKYSGKEGTPPIVNKLGSGDWESKKNRVRKKVRDIAKELIELYAKRKQSPGHGFSEDGFLQAELESSFLYEDTPDQAKATEDVKRDMQRDHPMDRLVCGDVGFGKTEVAIRAAFKAATDGRQVAVLVPTTILAMQHHRTFSERLKGFPVRIEYVSRFKSERDIKKTLADLESGDVNIIIGTHRIISKDVKFRNLGLLVVDEEQKFGVKVKDRLKEMKVNVDVLTLTATPIPRTLHFSLMGARDLSIIATPPSNRQPVTTEVHTFGDEIIRDSVAHELRRGGQVFFVHNRISDIDQIANTIFRLVPDARIGIAHGQMEGDQLERVMMRFIEGEYDVLVSTNIIESGLDIPNANTIIINQAHMFGLSDLHQMRGRVGRSNRKAFCYLLTSPGAMLSSDSRKRLAALEEFSELGDGFKVAMRDLDIRGAGNLLGAEQSGFINDLGFDTYHKILDEAIQELKETDFKELFSEELSAKAQLIVQDCAIETDLEILIPETYIANISERLQLYAALDNLPDETALAQFRNSVQDRFGVLPAPVEQLMDSVRLRWIGERLGIAKIVLKNEKMRAEFTTEKQEYFKSETFGRILQFIQSHPRRCKLKDSGSKLVLTIDDLPSVEATLDFLRPIST